MKIPMTATELLNFAEGLSVYQLWILALNVRADGSFSNHGKDHPSSRTRT